MILSLAVTIYLPLLLALALVILFLGNRKKRLCPLSLSVQSQDLSFLLQKFYAGHLFIDPLLLIFYISSIVTGAIWLREFHL